MKRLSPEEKRAKELRAAVASIGTSTKEPVRYQIPNFQRTPEVTHVDLQALKREILAEIQKEEELEMSPETAKALIQAMKKLPEQDRLEVQDIRNHQAFIFGGNKYGVHEMMHGAGSAGSSTTTYVYNEVAGGSGTTFTLAHTPNAGTVALYGNGQRLLSGAGNDYTISGSTITILEGSYSAGTVLADYNYAT